MTPNSKLTLVTIIGTFHGSMRGMKHYTPSKLKTLIADSQPDILAIEIRPKDFQAGRLDNNPWDMNEIVIPYAKSNDIPIEPIDWWPDDLRARHDLALKEIEKSVDGKKLLIEIDDEWAPHKSDFPDYNEVTPEYIHSPEFSRRESEYRANVKRQLGEGPQNLMWYTRAEKINGNLDGVLKKYPGKRITVVVGASHRPDIERFLESQPQVQLQSLYK
jgi:hypothetical protein